MTIKIATKSPTEEEKADLTKKIKSAEKSLESKFKKDIEDLPYDYRSRI